MASTAGCRLLGSSGDCPRAVSTFALNERFWTRKKSQIGLVQNDFAQAFQAYDEGSIPFTRSNDIKSFFH